MGVLREKMIEEIRLRNFSPRTEQSYVSAMVGLAKYYRSVTGSTQPETDPGLSVASQRTGFIANLAQRGDLGDEVLLSPVSGVERKAVIYSAKKTQLAITRDIKLEGSRAIAVGCHKAARSLFVDDRLRHRA